jgi:hypothetical protein
MLQQTRTLQTEMLDVSVTGSAANVAGASATTRGGLRHRCRADGLRVLDLRGADRHLQSNLWWHGGLLSSGHRGGFLDDLFHRLGGSLSSLWRLWCRLLHGHSCRDVAPFGLDA